MDAFGFEWLVHRQKIPNTGQMSTVVGLPWGRQSGALCQVPLRLELRAEAVKAGGQPKKFVPIPRIKCRLS
jgi:hypothetical protein